MKLRYAVRHARRNLLHAKSRTLLTIFAIAIGALTLTLSLAAGEGMRQYAEAFVEKYVDTSALSILKDKRSGEISRGLSPEPSLYDSTDFNDGNYVYGKLTQKDMSTISKLPGIASASLNYDLKTEYIVGANGKKYSGSSQPYNPYTRQSLVAGNVPVLKKDIADHEVVIPERYIKSLGFSSPSDSIGKQVTLYYDGPTVAVAKTTSQKSAQSTTTKQQKSYSFTVIAVSKKAGNTLLELDRPFLVPNAIAKQIAEFQKEPGKDISSFYGTARLKPSVDMIKAQETVQSKGFAALTPRDSGANLFSIVDVLSYATIAFAIITVIASVFGIVNTQYISVLQRTRYIGLMKALGMQTAHVRRVFIIEAAFIGLLGGMVGVGLALIIGTLTDSTLAALLGFDTGDKLFIFDPVTIFELIASLVIIAIISGLLPARKAARMDPIKALRTE
jgi:putative ABC transport system permease protein